MSLPTPRLLEPRNSRALVIMARCPRPGQCKTRLCPPLRPAEASALYGAFLEDIGREVQQLKTVCDIWVAWAGEDGDEEQVRSFFPGDVRLLQQQGASLAERMEHVFDSLLDAGYRSVLMRNSDSPHLPQSILDDAFTVLDRGGPGSLVVGPDLDGGYYLLGLDASPRGLLPGAMSTESVLTQTLQAARSRGLAIHQMPVFLDVDTPDDLALFWLEFGERADVRHWATWRTIAQSDMLSRLETSE